MFEMFGRERQYRRVADRIGKEVHRQLRQALKEKATVFETPAEMAFTAGYLKSFTFVGFSEIGCQDIDTNMEYIKYFCNGVLPGCLWDIVQRGEALNTLSQEGNRDEFVKTRQSYKIGVDAGISDGGNFFDNGVEPKNFEYFLSKGSIEIPNA
jgi:hypothetical protein